MCMSLFAFLSGISKRKPEKYSFTSLYIETAFFCQKQFLKSSECEAVFNTDRSFGGNSLHLLRPASAGKEMRSSCKNY